jgi:hypothetical protein
MAVPVALTVNFLPWLRTTPVSVQAWVAGMVIDVVVAVAADAEWLTARADAEAMMALAARAAVARVAKRASMVRSSGALAVDWPAVLVVMFMVCSFRQGTDCSVPLVRMGVGAFVGLAWR